METVPTDAAVGVTHHETLVQRVQSSRHGGFPTVDACRAARDLLHDGWREDHTDLGYRSRTGELTNTAAISVAPGGLVLVRRTRPAGREAVTWDEPAHDLEQLALIVHCLTIAFCGAVLPCAGPIYGPPEPRTSTPCRWWSSRSRSRMVRALSTVDWAPVFLIPGTRPAMLTLTYPGDWLTVAPDAAAAKRHLRLFHERLRRLYRKLDLPDPTAIWKLEFQRRGAPHFHIYVPVPVGRLGEMAGHRCAEMNIQQWASMTWANIVNHPDPEQKLRHLQAGTGVDFAEGSRCSDPKRLAVYFTRHNSKGSRSKAYQHRVPDGWATAGRWWGTWGAARILEEAPVTDHELVQAKRLLRRWVRSQRVNGEPRTSPRQVRRGVTSAGVVRTRWVSRRYEVRSLAMGQGGFVICNDGPAAGAMVARFLEALRSET